MGRRDKVSATVEGQGGGWGDAGKARTPFVAGAVVAERHLVGRELDAALEAFANVEHLQKAVAIVHQLEGVLVLLRRLDAAWVARGALAGGHLACRLAAAARGGTRRRWLVPSR